MQPRFATKDVEWSRRQRYGRWLPLVMMGSALLLPFGVLMILVGPRESRAPDERSGAVAQRSSSLPALPPLPQTGAVSPARGGASSGSRDGSFLNQEALRDLSSTPSADQTVETSAPELAPSARPATVGRDDQRSTMPADYASTASGVAA